MKNITRKGYVEMMLNKASKSRTGRISLYTVREAIWGLDKPVLRWFADYNDAKRYSQRDYTDNPERHTYTAEHAEMWLDELWLISTREELWRSLGEFEEV